MSNFQKRPFRTFISHSHANKAVVDLIYHWLHSVAEISTWYDGVNFPPGGPLGTELGNAVQQCQSMIIVLSRDAVRSGWVKEEYNLAVAQRASYKAFSIIPMLLEDCEIPGFLESTAWIDIRDGQFDFKSALALLKGFYYDVVFPDVERTQDVYISRGWRPSDTEADYVCHMLARAGFRLIGDDEDQPKYDIERVRAIIAGCGGLVAVLPHREGSSTSPYVISEIEMARQLDLPYVIVADPNMKIDEPLRAAALEVIAEGIDDTTVESPGLSQAIELLQAEWKSPISPFYSFFATDLRPEVRERTMALRELAQLITAMPCLIGDNVRYGQIQHAIRRQVASASMIVADISNRNVNACIEAGVALGAHRPLSLLAKAPRRSPPFMLRDQQVYHYSNDLELLGMYHMLVRPYRRNVLNVRFG